MVYVSIGNLNYIFTYVKNAFMIAKLLLSEFFKERDKKINEFLVQIKISNPHPDLLIFPKDSKLGIEQARKIKDYFSLKPYSAKGKTVVLEDASALTKEAQNALLKTLEELPKNALFLLGSDSESRFLPTVLSRCQIIHLTDTDLSSLRHMTYEVYTKDIEKLMESTTEQRFEYIEKLKDREELLRSLLNYFHKTLLKPSSFLKELALTTEWEQQNVNIRAILEYLMLVMPQKL